MNIEDLDKVQMITKNISLFKGQLLFAKKDIGERDWVRVCNSAGSGPKFQLTADQVTVIKTLVCAFVKSNIEAQKEELERLGVNINEKSTA